MTQGTLIRKLCTYTAPNPTWHAIFEFDKLVRSIYTLRHLRNGHWLCTPLRYNISWSIF